MMSNKIFPKLKISILMGILPQNGLLRKRREGDFWEKLKGGAERTKNEERIMNNE